jgi:FtsH-binding integral membrane protein
MLEITGQHPDIQRMRSRRFPALPLGTTSEASMAQYETVRSVGVGARAAIDEGLRAHMNKVYGLMSVAMLVTAGVAWGVGTTDALMEIFRDPMTLRPNILGWVVMFAPLAMVFAFGALINRMSAAGAQLFFYAFAAVMGLSLAWIFKVFTGVSIAQTFLITAIAFAGLSLYGYVTKRDLSGMGTFLIMGLIGLIVAMVVNIFLASSALAFAISAIGLLIFAGLTAYDTQKIKMDYVQHAQAMDSEWLAKSAIMGALNLYLDFINMFMFLLQFLGNRE